MDMVPNTLHTELTAPCTSKLGTHPESPHGRPSVFGRLGVDSAWPDQHAGSFTLSLNRQDCPSFGDLFLWLSLPISETIPETACRLFTSSPFILIPQNYLVTIQGDTEYHEFSQNTGGQRDSQGRVEDSGHCTYNCKLVCLTLYSTLLPSSKEGEKERNGKGRGGKE